MSERKLREKESDSLKLKMPSKGMKVLESMHEEINTSAFSNKNNNRI